MLLLAGITLGLLFNPMTGPQTRKWLMDKIAGDGDATTSRTRRPARAAASELARRRRSDGYPFLSRAPSFSAETGATSARSSEPGSRPLALEMSLEPSRKAPGRGAVADSGTGGAQPRPAAKRDVLEPLPGDQVRVRLDHAVVAERRAAPTGWISKWRWYGVLCASPVLPTKPTTSPAWTSLPFRASGENAERCA